MAVGSTATAAGSFLGSVAEPAGVACAGLSATSPGARSPEPAVCDAVPAGSFAVPAPDVGAAVDSVGPLAAGDAGATGPEGAADVVFASEQAKAPT